MRASLVTLFKKFRIPKKTSTAGWTVQLGETNVVINKQKLALAFYRRVSYYAL